MPRDPIYEINQEGRKVYICGCSRVCKKRYVNQTTYCKHAVFRREDVAMRLAQSNTQKAGSEKNVDMDLVQGTSAVASNGESEDRYADRVNERNEFHRNQDFPTNENEVPISEQSELVDVRDLRGARAHPTAQRYEQLISEADHTTLVRLNNRAYMELLQEIARLRSQVDSFGRAYQEILVNMKSSASDAAPTGENTNAECRSTGLPQQSKYPRIKFWHHGAWFKYKRELSTKGKTNTQAEETCQGRKPHSAGNGEPTPRGDNLELGFMEHEDGELFSDIEKDSIRRACRGVFLSLAERGIAPQTWGQLSTEAVTEFRTQIENLFPDLALCENHWKVDHLGTVLYPRWKQKRPQLFANSRATSQPVSAQSRPSIHSSARQEPGERLPAASAAQRELGTSSGHAPRTSIGASMASRESQEALTSASASPTGIYSFMQAQEMPGSSRTSSARITLFETASGNPPGDAAPLESSCDISARPDSAIRIQLTEPNAGDKRPAPADQDRTGTRKRIITIESSAVASSSVDMPFANIMPSAESTSQAANSVAGRLGRTGGETVTQRNEIEGNSARVKDETDAAQYMRGDGMVLNITPNVPNARNISAHEWKATRPEGRSDEFDKAFASSKEQL